jgi:hypothetical protein
LEQTPEPRRCLNVLTKAERRKRIFARLREGWVYDEIARDERLSVERIRQIAAEVIDKRVIDRGIDHAKTADARLADRRGRRSGAASSRRSLRSSR